MGAGSRRVNDRAGVADAPRSPESVTIGEWFNNLVDEMRRSNASKAAMIPPALLLGGVAFILLAVFDPDRSVGSALTGIGLLALAVMFFRAYQRPLPPPPPVAHEVFIQSSDDAYFAHCSCGWMSEENDSQQIVEAEARQHAPDVTIEILDSEPRDPATLGVAYVGNDVLDRGLPVLVAYRELPTVPGDSGWRMHGGKESAREAENADAMTPCDMGEMVERDPTLADVVFTQGPCAFERDRVDEPFRRVPIDFGSEEPRS